MRDFFETVIVPILVLVIVGAVIAGVCCGVAAASKSGTEQSTTVGRFVFKRVEDVPGWSFVVIHDTATGKDYLGARHGGIVELGAAPAEAP